MTDSVLVIGNSATSICCRLNVVGFEPLQQITFLPCCLPSTTLSFSDIVGSLSHACLLLSFLSIATFCVKALMIDLKAVCTLRYSCRANHNRSPCWTDTTDCRCCNQQISQMQPMKMCNFTLPYQNYLI